MVVMFNPTLIDFGTIAYNKKEEFETEVVTLKKKNLALATSTKKGNGKRFSCQKNKGKRNFKGNQKSDMSKIKCYNCNKMGHMLDTASVGREREDSMHLLLKLMKNLRIREQGNPMMINQPDRSKSRSFSSQLFLILSPTVWKLGWWIVGLLDI